MAPWREPVLDEGAAEIERELGRYRGRDCRLGTWARRPSEYRTSHALDEVDVVLADGSVFDLVVKDLSRRGLTELARRAKPAFLADPRREIETYRGILMPAGVGTAICYGASVDPRADRYRLLLERVAGVELSQAGDRSVWCEVARWLARFHARFAGDEARSAARSAAPLLFYDRDFYRCWPRRALAFAEGSTIEVRRKTAWLVERYDPVVERLAALPVTVIHGECYASNVIVQETGGGVRVCPVDWEMAAIGPGLIDLAALTAGAWPEEDRTRFARAYHEALPLDAARRQPFAEVLTDLRFCRLHLAVQWLGWAAGWTPPPAHRHDWLGEAIALAEELQL